MVAILFSLFSTAVLANSPGGAPSFECPTYIVGQAVADSDAPRIWISTSFGKPGASYPPVSVVSANGTVYEWTERLVKGQSRVVVSPLPFVTGRKDPERVELKEISFSQAGRPYVFGVGFGKRASEPGELKTPYLLELYESPLSRPSDDDKSAPQEVWEQTKLQPYAKALNLAGIPAGTEIMNVAIAPREFESGRAAVYLHSNRGLVYRNVLNSREGVHLEGSWTLLTKSFLSPTLKMIDTDVFVGEGPRDELLVFIQDHLMEGPKLPPTDIQRAIGGLGIHVPKRGTVLTVWVSTTTHRHESWLWRWNVGQDSFTLEKAHPPKGVRIIDISGSFSLEDNRPGGLYGLPDDRGQGVHRVVLGTIEKRESGYVYAVRGLVDDEMPLLPWTIDGRTPTERRQAYLDKRRKDTIRLEVSSLVERSGYIRPRGRPTWRADFLEKLTEAVVTHLEQLDATVVPFHEIYKELPERAGHMIHALKQRVAIRHELEKPRSRYARAKDLMDAAGLSLEEQIWILHILGGSDSSKIPGIPDYDHREHEDALKRLIYVFTMTTGQLMHYEAMPNPDGTPAVLDGSSKKDAAPSVYALHALDPENYMRVRGAINTVMSVIALTYALRVEHFGTDDYFNAFHNFFGLAVEPPITDTGAFGGSDDEEMSAVHEDRVGLALLAVIGEFDPLASFSSKSEAEQFRAD